MAIEKFNKRLEEIVEQGSGLKRGLKSRHIFMITLGGVIGTGLFLSSGYTIHEAGPGGAIVAYILGGIIMYLVMLCLGELAVAMPVSGSFQTYATEFIHPSVGFMIGWLYWFNGAVTIGTDLLAAGILLKSMAPGISEWFSVLTWGFILFGLNSLPISAFGESEFWFAGVKVIAIICCILTGSLAIFGYLGGHEAIGFSNYFNNGGLFPHGFTAVMLTMVTVAFAFNGTEIIGITAGESDDPQKTIPRAVRGTAIRTILCYLLSIIVIAAVLPWQKAGLSKSVFAEVFEYSGIPGAFVIVNIVVVISALSCANSWAYSASRILWSLAKDENAPSCFAKLNRFKVPMNALIITMFVALMSLLCSIYAATTVYLWFLSISGLAGVVGWMGICASQYFFRRKYIAAGGKVENLKFRTPFFPLVPILGFILNFAVVVSLWFVEDQRVGLYTGSLFIGFVFLYYFFMRPKLKLA